MPAVVHSDQGRKFENHLMQELCLLLGAHKNRTTPYHLASDGLVERFNRTLLIMFAMFAGNTAMTGTLTLSGYATILNWLMTRCVQTQARLCDDRNAFMISWL